MVANHRGGGENSMVVTTLITTGYETGTGIGQLMNEERMMTGQWLVVSALCFRLYFDAVGWMTGRTPEKPMSLVLKGFIREQVDGKPTENRLSQVYLVE